jgi:hypothetical protein
LEAVTGPQKAGKAQGDAVSGSQKTDGVIRSKGAMAKGSEEMFISSEPFFLVIIQINAGVIDENPD